ncbi:prolyl 3-hydroxylase OGFOD1-like [Amphiura filiformis]|uniref:prolyl 3-hydroxylase OGFOD1-like n=1 Tax=Amphiura filiformis TaxID=82378 RepID=UPI003B2202DC
MSSKRDVEDKVEEKDTPRKKRSKSDRNRAAPADVNSTYTTEEFKKVFGEAFRKHKEFQHDSGAMKHSEPFNCCCLPNFVDDKDNFLEGLKSELLELPYREKDNDLYTFQQSEALQNFSSPHIQGLRKLLYEDFRGWLRDATGIAFSDTIDMTASKYTYADYLLCHDDELEGRRIAFILYLVPSWNQEDGGSLDLFKVDDNYQPVTIAKSLLPKWNNFVFFEVTPKSFHQVAEVLSEDKCRLSVSGWFHGPTVERPTPYIEPRSELTPHVSIDEELFYGWLNPKYLDLLTQSDIQDRFEQASEIQLSDFLMEEKFDNVCKAMQNPDIRWNRRGPYNKRNYEQAEESSLPEAVKECIHLMRSEHMFLLLSNFSGLKLHEQAPSDGSSDEDDDSDNEEEQEEEEEEERGAVEKGKQKEANLKVKNSAQGNEGKPRKPVNPRCRVEVRRWSPGCYTLCHDTDMEGSEFALDAVIYFKCATWDVSYMGFTSYIAKGEDEVLLCVYPDDNSLGLVYRDKETMGFVKYINNRSKREAQIKSEPVYFYDIKAVYYE